MRRIQFLQQSAGLVLGVIVSAHVASAAPQQAAAAQPAVRTAGQQYRAVKVLTEMPAPLMQSTMHLITAQLGTGCQLCHVWGEWFKDDKPMKDTARRMMQMTIDINKNMFGGKTVVTCYTCHQGHQKPVSTVALPVSYPPPPPDLPPAPAARPTPSVDQVLSKYVTALGGEPAIRKVTSRIITGRRDIPTTAGGIEPAPSAVMIYQKAPNLSATTYTPDKKATPPYTAAEGVDATGAWTQAATGAVAALTDPDAGRAKRLASLYEPLDMKQNYKGLEVKGIEKLGAREAYLVVGTADGDNPEKLWFDTQTGLLLRREWYIDTFFGQSPLRYDFEDYRDAGGGVKMPFTIRMNPSAQRQEVGTASTFKITKVQMNVPVEDSKLARPTPPPPAARGAAPAGRGAAPAPGTPPRP